MKEVKYIDPETFEENTTSFDEEHMDITEAIKEALKPFLKGDCAQIQGPVYSDTAIRVGIMTGNRGERKKFTIKITQVSDEAKQNT